MNQPVNLASRIEHWSLDRLTEYDRNPRLHSAEQVTKIAASIAEFGFTNPILADGDGVIIAGHGRLMAATELGLDEVPVIVLDHLTAAQRKALVMADNRLALDSSWSEELLGELLGELDADGYDLGDGGTADEDDVPEPGPDLISRPGDVWRLGRHRVMCGDSTSHDDAATLMDGKLADCLWTDPPYNVNYESKAGKIQNDHMAADAFGEFLAAVYQTAIDVMRPGAPAYIAHADTEGLAFRREFEAAGFYLSGCLIWRKNSLVLGRSDYHWQHEPILYGWKPGAAHSWYGARNKTTIQEFEGLPVEQVGDNEWQIGTGETAIIVTGDNIEVQIGHGTVFYEEKPRSSAMHPTMKPVALIERQLRNSTKRGDAVLDLFGGSGSTLIAAEKLGLDARLMELDPRFVDVICRRFQEFTGRPARLDADGRTFDEVEQHRQSANDNVREAAAHTA